MPGGRLQAHAQTTTGHTTGHKAPDGCKSSVVSPEAIACSVLQATPFLLWLQKPVHSSVDPPALSCRRLPCGPLPLHHTARQSNAEQGTLHRPPAAACSLPSNSGLGGLRCVHFSLMAVPSQACKQGRYTAACPPAAFCRRPPCVP